MYISTKVYKNQHLQYKTTQHDVTAQIFIYTQRQLYKQTSSIQKSPTENTVGTVDTDAAVAEGSPRLASFSVVHFLNPQNLTRNITSRAQAFP